MYQCSDRIQRLWRSFLRYISYLCPAPGIPSQTGTTELTVHVINVNDKKPYFTPSIQRAGVSADAALGTVLHNLIAVDPDITDVGQLVFELDQGRMIRAVDKNGKEVRVFVKEGPLEA